MSGPSSSRRRSIASAATSASTRPSRPTPRSSSTSASVSAPFGRLTDAQWEHVTRSNVRQRADGRWRLAYDPGIAVPFRASAAPPDLWDVWDAIRCPTLVLRGAQSDLLSAATAAEMGKRGPKPAIIEFADVGHAPMLLSAEQIDPVARFLRAASDTAIGRGATANPDERAAALGLAAGRNAPASLTIVARPWP